MASSKNKNLMAVALVGVGVVALVAPRFLGDGSAITVEPPSLPGSGDDTDTPDSKLPPPDEGEQPSNEGLESLGEPHVTLAGF